MRMGLAMFTPVKHGLTEREPPEVIDLVRRLETAMDEGREISLHGLMADLEALPPAMQHTRSFRCMQGWLLGEVRQHARALTVLDSLVAECSKQVDGPAGPVAMRWITVARAYEGLLYIAIGRPDRAAQSFTDARRWLERVMGPKHPLQILDLDSEEADRLKGMDPTGFAALLLDTLHLFDAEKDGLGVARVANNLGHLYLDLGEPMGARYWFERSVELLQQRPGDLFLVYALDSLGQCYQQLGMFAEARPVLEEALLRATRLEAPSLQACILEGLADLDRDTNREDAAQDQYLRAHDLEEQLRNPAGLARIQLGLATLHRRAGRPALSLEAAAEAESLLRFEGISPLRNMARLQMHIAAILMGRLEAAPALQEVVALLAAQHARREETLGRWYLALAAWRSRRQEEALSQLSVALTLAVSYRHLHLLALELPLTAELVQPVLERGLCPEGAAGLMLRATPAGLTALLAHAPASAPVLAAVGRLGEARALSIHLLGLFRVERGGQEIDLQAARSQKAVSLFKYLLGRRGQLVTREQILDTIWPEVDPEGADRSFQVTLSTLRRLLDPADGPPVIIRRGRGYMLNPEIPLSVDVDRFLTHAKQGNWWWEQGQSQQAAVEWHLAEECYGGELLAEDPYEDWAIVERERLREQYLDLLLHLAEIALREKRYPEVIDRANRILDADPIRESAYRVLMQAHASMGDRAVALRDFRRCAATLKRELGEEPMTETQELASQIWTALHKGI